MEKEYRKYEYINVKIKYSLARKCGKCYESFGWEVLQEKISGEGKELSLRRSKKIRNRAGLMAEQWKMEDAMKRVEHYEYRKELRPTIICILVGMVGAAFFACAIIALTHGNWLLFFLLLIPGVILCTLPVWLKNWLMIWHVDDYREEVRDQNKLIYDACRAGRKILAEEGWQMPGTEDIESMAWAEEGYVGGAGHDASETDEREDGTYRREEEKEEG